MEERTYLSGTSLAGMSPTRSRVENDYYATPFEATEAILSQEELHGSILEPAAGEGHISKVLREHYPNSQIISTDLVQRDDRFGCGIVGGVDFLTENYPEKFNNVITNPPFSLAKEFAEKALEVSTGKVILFAKIQFLEGRQRKDFFATHPPKAVYVFSKRVNPLRNGLEVFVNPLTFHLATKKTNIGGTNLDYRTALFCEFDRYAAESYCAVHGVDPTLNIGDITKADEKVVPDFNVMFGGSPCQDFSIAGKQGGAAWTCKHCGHVYNPLEAHYDQRDHCPKCGSTEIEKTRSSLLVEWLRFLREKKPRFAIYENVKNITGSRFYATFNLFVKELEDYGYNVYWQVLNAKHYGIPQNRERVYCVIIRKDLDNGKFKFPSPIPLKKALVDMLEDKVDERYYLPDDKVAAMITPPRSDKSVTPSVPAEEVPQTTTAGTCSLAGVKLSKKGTQFEGYCETALTLLARDYKGFGNQQMTGVMEHNE